MATEKISSFTTDETRFLSNFYPYKTKTGEKYPHKVSVYMNGIEFDCVENAYQAAKLLSKEEQIAFSKMTPYETKAIMDAGLKEVRPDWENIKLDIMTELVFQKFLGSKDLTKLLLATEEKELVEGNTWGDIFWGICDGKGQNHLGQILMAVRSYLRDGKNSQNKSLQNLRYQAFHVEREKQ